MKRFLPVLFFMLPLLLLATSCNGQASLTPTSTPTSITAIATPTSITAIAPPTSTESISPAASGVISNVATRYYQAITKQNYKLAYTYLDPAATKLSLAAFTLEAQSHDTQEGVVQSYSVATFASMVVMTNMRVHIGPYHVHLEFNQEGSSWKIVALDGI